MTHRAWGFLLATAFLAGGCVTTLKVKYDPSYRPVYAFRLDRPVAIKAVTDVRGLPAHVFYKKGPAVGKYDRPVGLIVLRALHYEFQRVGIRLVDPEAEELPPDLLVLECDVLDFSATIEEGTFTPDSLTLSVELVFKWSNPFTGRTLETNNRAVRYVRKSKRANQNQLPTYGSAMKGYGNDLINNLLPRVIEKELRLCDCLHGRTPPPKKPGKKPGKK